MNYLEGYISTFCINTTTDTSLASDICMLSCSEKRRGYVRNNSQETRKVHQHILAILADKPGRNCQLSCLRSFKSFDI